MALLYFNKEKVRQLVAVSKEAKSFRVPYKPRQSSTDPVLWLVGDQGVYLMFAGRPHVSHPVIYADGLDPERNEFEDWWEEKRETFGPDDGIEPIPLRDIETGLRSENARLVIDIEPNHLSVVTELVDAGMVAGRA